MSLFKKLAVFILLLFISTQFIIPCLMKPSFIYNERIIYDVFKNNTLSMDTSIKYVKQTITREKLKDYIIVLGDSVAYSNPCPPENSIGFYMNSISKSENKNIRVFNLSAPSMIAGDIYTVIKLLRQYGISTQNLIIDFCYWEFIIKSPVFWLTPQIKRLEPQTYKTAVLPHLKETPDLWDNAKQGFEVWMNSNIALLEYRDFISFNIQKKANNLLRNPKPVIQPWYKKRDAIEIMRNSENKWYATSKPFTFDEKNPQIYFLNKIIEMQKGTNTVYFLAAMNDKLLPKETSKPGYKENMKRIDNYFSSKNVKYINYNKKIDYDLFTDHVHLVPQGYKFLAEDLWKRINS